MNLSKTVLTLFLSTLLFTSCSKDSNDSNDGRPEPGTSVTITKEIEYEIGLIEGTTSWAIWPVAKFPVDPYAIKYSVKELISGITYTWESDEKTACAYHVFPSTNDIKDGLYYVGLSRTWCAGCKEADPQWMDTYIKLYGTKNKVEITFYY